MCALISACALIRMNMVIFFDFTATGPPQIPKTLYLPSTTLSLQSPTTPGEVSVTSPNSTVTAPASVSDSQSRYSKTATQKDRK